MTETVRTILIVEDQERWKKRIKRYCRSVHQELYRTDANIISVSNLADAINEFKTYPVIHFASIDLNLAEDTPNEQHPGGLQLLKEMWDHNPETVSIVVSGEVNLRFPAISKKYGVLTFQQKNQPEFRATYLTALRAALLYVDAKELLGQGDYDEALVKWQQAKAVVRPIEESIEAEDWSFPTDIEKELKNLKDLRRARATHSVTGLPTSKLVEQELTRLLSQNDEWVLVYLQIKELEAFTQSQGVSATEALFEVTRNIVKAAFVSQNWSMNFFGQTSDGIFVVTSDDLSRGKQALKKLVKHIKDEFYTGSLPNYDLTTRERGRITYTDINGVQNEAPLASLVVGIIQEERNESDRFASYTDHRQLDKVARNAARSNQYIRNGNVEA